MGKFFKDLFTKKNEFEEYSNQQLREYISDARQQIRNNVNKPQYSYPSFGYLIGLFGPPPLITYIRQMEAELDRRAEAEQQSKINLLKKV